MKYTAFILNAQGTKTRAYQMELQSAPRLAENVLLNEQLYIVVATEHDEIMLHKSDVAFTIPKSVSSHTIPVMPSYI